MDPYIALMSILAILPAHVDRGAVADVLRTVARNAGCETPVVEMQSLKPGKYVEIRVWCRREETPNDRGSRTLP